MLDMNSSQPLYEQIKQHILYNIHTGKFTPHTRIPSERSLSKQLGVSRLTVNKAIKELIQDGWLYVQIGKGTFINDGTIDQELDTLTGFTEEMAKRGQRADSYVLEIGVQPASDTVAQTLRIAKGLPVVRLKRIRRVNNQPIALETSSLIVALCPNIERYDFSKLSLYDILRNEYDIRLVYAQQTFESRRATDDEAHHLKLKKGSPILAIARVTYADNDAPVEYVESVYRGDKYKFTAILRRI